VQISANAGHNEIVGWHGERLKIKIKAPAFEGKANEALLRFLADQFGIHRRDIRIERGNASTIKLLAFESLDEPTLMEKLTVRTRSSKPG